MPRAGRSRQGGAAARTPESLREHQREGAMQPPAAITIPPKTPPKPKTPPLPKAPPNRPKTPPKSPKPQPKSQKTRPERRAQRELQRAERPERPAVTQKSVATQTAQPAEPPALKSCNNCIRAARTIGETLRTLRTCSCLRGGHSPPSRAFAAARGSSPQPRKNRLDRHPASRVPHGDLPHRRYEPAKKANRNADSSEEKKLNRFRRILEGREQQQKRVGRRRGATGTNDVRPARSQSPNRRRPTQKKSLAAQRRREFRDRRRAARSGRSRRPQRSAAHSALRTAHSQKKRSPLH